MKKQFFFTVDDNIRFLKELTEEKQRSIFDHPYLAVYRRLHEKHGLKVQLNLFYECEGFTLADMTDAYREEFAENADWLKMSFHSRLENVHPYREASYTEVYADCDAVQREIVRFASPAVLAKTTTLHFCTATAEGLRAMRELGTAGLLGLYGTESAPRTSYQTSTPDGDRIRAGEIITDGEIAYAGIDIVLNCYKTEENLSLLAPLLKRPLVKVMIHEQYYYPDYSYYQPNFEEKLDAVFSLLTKAGYQSTFFEFVLN